MLYVECYFAPQFFGLPYQHMMIAEDDKTRVFLRSRTRVKTSPRVIDQSYRRRWIYAAIFSLYPVTFKRLSKREWLCFPSNAALRFLAYNIFSKRKLGCDYFCVNAYIFVYGSKIVLSFPLLWTEEILGYLHRNFPGFLCTVSTYVNSYMYIYGLTYVYIWSYIWPLSF